MIKTTIFVISLVLAQNSAHALSPIHYYIEKQIQKREQRREIEAQKKSFLSELGVALVDQEGIFEQAIDHVGKRKDHRTFRQRYFLNTQLAKAEDAPTIYVICGEGTCDGASTMPAVNAVARKLGANLIALEHRFYGKSQPFTRLTAENLKYLSTTQALEDLVAFQRYAQEKFNLKGKWIAVGGSYPGSLSAFYRLKHPELVAGALASSAPVLAKADFYEYDRHVARVAGPECLAAIKEGVAKAEEMLRDPDQTKEVKKMFDASEVRDNVDFLYILADMAAIAIQYGYQEPFCDALITENKKGKVLQGYAKAGLKLFADFGITPVQDSFQGAESTDPADYLGWAGMRSWMYQSCTEYGYFQVANKNEAESSRSSLLSLEYHNDVCNRLFGLTRPVDENATNKKFYNKLFDQSVTNILFTNGSNDPWSNLSLTLESPGLSRNPGLILKTINGAAHCDDLGSRRSAALVEAREVFSTLAEKWISGKKNQFIEFQIKLTSQ